MPTESSPRCTPLRTGLPSPGRHSSAPTARRSPSLWAPWEGEQGIQAGDWQVRVVDLGTGEETDLTLPAWEGHSQEMVCVQWLDDHALQVTAYDLTAMQSGAADASITWTCTLAG